MVGGIGSSNYPIRFRLDILQNQLDAALNAYAAVKNQASLLEVLKTQTQMMDLLLSANNLQTARSLDRSRRIQSL